MKTLDNFIQFSPKKKEIGLNKKAIIYTRVSTKEQADNNTSLETQKKYCENYAKQHDLEVIEYFGGTYESAKSDERKEFKRMLKYVKQSGKIGYIIVYSYDRFSRSGSNASQISHELLEQGVLVKAVTQDVDATSASGKFQQNLFLLFSQFDNELRKDKTITAMTDLLRKGYWLWNPPVGYINNKKYRKAVDWEIVPSKDAKFLKKAFKWKAQQLYSNAEIVEKLQSYGMNINERRIGEVFKNPFYCGLLVAKMIPGEVIIGKHEPLVSKEDFLKINDNNASYPVIHKCDNDFLPLKRFIYCENCKLPLTGFLVKKKGLYYYKCRNKKCSCSKSANKLHESFKEELQTYQLDSKYKDIIEEVMLYTYDNLTKEIRNQSANIKKQITELNFKIDAIEERFAIGEIDESIYQKFKAKYQTQLDVFNKTINNSSISSSNLEKALKKAVNLSSKLNEIWESGDLRQKQNLQKLVFPYGLGYDKLNDKVQTLKVNSIFSSIPMIASKVKGIKNGESINFDKFSALVTSAGFKPATF